MRERGVRVEWCEAVLKDYIQQEIDEKGCTAYWGKVPGRKSPPKVVVGTDGRSLATARFDRHFQPAKKSKAAAARTG